jgi:hypothetical protein
MFGAAIREQQVKQRCPPSVARIFSAKFVSVSIPFPDMSYKKAPSGNLNGANFSASCCHPAITAKSSITQKRLKAFK